ncbi:Crp/Fnr family transcriptional regulator [Flavobacterium jejuense]|uniref:Crp/Fnr family transcriptional regulator n=1 Tax=Flavobacterium jejuense TaxID=1544455 RepID=A0ABX0INP9_9FLAO|nr:Crp/Fnr family transcriptional regulator [Flavobacterium jejuense]NHN24103.1 Crp/Fnr family transcriptional regulator [Flavobacterium jejuense]
MQIDLDLLFTWGAVSKKYYKDHVIFDEGESALFYFQIIEGTVKMYCSNDDGKEFTQGIFEKGCSFGEPPLFLDEIYPCTAVATEDSVVIKLSKDKFLTIIEEYPEINKRFMQLLALRVFRKTLTNKHIINQKPEHRINAFLMDYKKINGVSDHEKLQIPFTRQEIADFTGLRVETVIRTLSQMNKCNKVEINNHKIFY